MYVAEHRYDCPFRAPDDARCHSPHGLARARSRTCFNPNKRNDAAPPGAGSAAKHRPKLLARSYAEDGRPGYWFIEPNNSVLVDLLGAPSARVPLIPLMVAVYGGSLHWRRISEVISEERFRDDLALGDERFLSLFDTDLRNEHNAAMLAFATAGRAAERDIEPAPAGCGLSIPVDYLPREGSAFVKRAGADSDPERRLRLLERATSNHRRALNALAAHLVLAGFKINEQLDGYDLFAVRDDVECLFEVKTWTDSNLAKQVRSGWAQLYEYRYRNTHMFTGDVRLFLVMDSPPPIGQWFWPWLVGELNVIPCWIDGQQLRTFREYQYALQDIS